MANSLLDSHLLQVETLVQINLKDKWDYDLAKVEPPLESSLLYDKLFKKSV